MKIQAAARIIFLLSGIVLSACNLNLPVNIGEVTGAKVGENSTSSVNVGINPNGGYCCDAAPLETPSATASTTPEQKKVLWLTLDYTTLNSFLAGFGFEGKSFLFGYRARAEGGNISFALTYTLSGEAAKEHDDSILSPIYQKGPDETTTRPGLKDGKIKHSAVTIKDGSTENIQLWPVGNITDENDPQWIKARKYNGKSVGFSIEKLSDIELLTKNVEVRAEFPLKYSDDKEIKFCCIN